MAKWSKKYEIKLDDSQLFIKHKQITLQVILLNVQLVVVQQMKSIKEYKQVEKYKDLNGTLLILKDICFADRNRGFTFQLMNSLGQCKQGLTLKQLKTNNSFYIENVQRDYQPFKFQTGKFLYGTASLVNHQGIV